MSSEQDNTAESVGTDDPITTAGNVASDAQPRGSLLRGLGTNLLCGLRLAFFRRVSLDRIEATVEQLIALALIDLALMRSM